ncbi:hypothetical protein IW262DRAFT_1459081 [Armillaria fumosa]|nr:hypothetical protein IW262DRAFT_1459081 [Armillaria fumosa]
MAEIISTLFALTEAKMDYLGHFVPSFYQVRRVGSVMLEIEHSKILQHWEDHFPHMFLLLTDFHKCKEDMAYVCHKKMKKIEAFLIRTGYLTRGDVPKDALESGHAALAELTAMFTSTVENLQPISTLTEGPHMDATLAAPASTPPAALVLTNSSPSRYFTRACAATQCEHMRHKNAVSCGNLPPSWVPQPPPQHMYTCHSNLSSEGESSASMQSMVR